MWSVYGSDHTRFRSQVNTDFAEYPLDVEGRRGGSGSLSLLWLDSPPWMSQCRFAAPDPDSCRGTCCGQWEVNEQDLSCSWGLFRVGVCLL